MEARNMEQLNAMLLKEVRKAMQITSEKSLAAMHEETGNFYTSGDDPIMYKRTGALGDTPKTTALNVQGNMVEFSAYLDTTHRYTTGKSPTMLDVLNLADKHITDSSVGKLRLTLGSSGFWKRSEKKIEREFKKTMGKFFRKG